MNFKSIFAALSLFIASGAIAQSPTVSGLLTSIISNDTSTGTTINKLAKLTSTGKAILPLTSDTDGVIGIVINGAGITASAQIAINGIVSCVFDATATTGNYVQISSSVAGDCKDSGASTRPSTGQVIGRVITGGSGTGTYTVGLQIGSPLAGTGNVIVSGSPTAGQSAVWTDATHVKGVVQPTVSTALNTGTTTGTGGFVSGTYTTPAGATWLEINMSGGGGGGSGSGTTPGSGGNGGNTTFGSSLLTANGGGPGLNTAAAGTGGSASGGYWNPTGQSGQSGTSNTNSPGGQGGASICNPGYGLIGNANQGGGTGVANTGGGGAGAGDAGTANTGAGGGGGGCLKAIITSPAATYAYSVGVGGSAGTAGTSGQAGGAGGSGKIIVIEHYN